MEDHGIPESEEVLLHTMIANFREIERISRTPGEGVEITFLDESDGADSADVIDKYLIVEPDDFQRFVERMAAFHEDNFGLGGPFGMRFREFRIVEEATLS